MARIAAIMGLLCLSFALNSLRWRYVQDYLEQKASLSAKRNIIRITANIPIRRFDEEAFQNEYKLQDNGMGERMKKMYRGLDTPVTKRLEASGVDFSGGEEQKIAIVRALYKDSPVLILGDPTSALDSVAEHEIYQKFAEMSEGRTMVYISHRIYSTRFCDKIAVFEKDEMKEYGTLDELMGQKGLYYDFYQQQAEYIK
nr:ATP-binding cassette domain-containing protein [uncultured Acetatifactor sp.]